MNRRIFLKSSGLALVAGGFLPNVFVRMARAGTPGSRRVLVVVFQRGAVDGLNVVVPFGEKAYYDARPSIAIPRPGSGENAALDLDGFFGLHPSLAPLLPLFKDGSAAFVHAAGSPDPTRSHFDAQDFMESGTPGVKVTADGFLSRALAGEKTRTQSPLRAVAITPALPRILAGSAGAVSMTNVSEFGIRAGLSSGAASDSFESMYGEAVAGTLGGTAKESFEAARIIKSADPAKRAAENGADYPKGPFGNSLKQIAQLVKSDVGLEVAFTDVGGWDTHAGEGGAQGQLGNRLRDYGQAIAAFAKDLGSRMADVTLVTVSEFGRTVRENGNRGTDHGHANVMLLLGGGVKGGKVYGRWPGLDAAKLYENRDLAVTTDFRDVFAEILEKRIGVRDSSAVFPGYGLHPDKRLGLITV
ncbi:MAG: DUF1501 domain-containing protein [Acidobacteriota bacterium]|nr:DUF1501 domain-containing protein [Acidobacteriota bacterium]